MRKTAYNFLVRDLADLFAALADPTRLAVIALLQRHGEMCVCEIQAVLDLSQSRASRQLKTLRLAGLVEDRRVGAWVHYRVPAQPGLRQRVVLEAASALLPAETAADIDARVAERRKAASESCDGPDALGAPA